LARADVPRIGVGADPKPVAAAMNAFGLDLYRRMASAPGNLVVSPASIELALAMTRPGARGETGTQMDAVMHGAGSDDLAPAISALQSALDSRSGTFRGWEGEELAVTLRIANAAFAQRGFDLDRAYLEALASRFDAGVRLVDYKSDLEAARQLINSWVGERTEQRIPELLAKDILTAMTRLVLANAIYLKAPWQTPFSIGLTTDRPFTRLDGSTVDVPMMGGLSTELPYAQGPGWEAVELPYAGGSLAMTVVVPDDPAEFDQGMTAAGFDAIVATLERGEVQLSMPRFDIETATPLGEQLTALGMPLAFDAERADFSGMTSAARLFIAHVIHQANITVDEAGTEAAAATAVVVNEVSAPAVRMTLNVDRPFLFAVRDVPTGAVLFLGRVVDPSITR
jgi:serpin B